ncbi:hypothetical protein [Streptomyces racemochromogenes]|uniref:hypothetical protein n=1 Tax=Streptomyces racemochromogenes TaxID=67353 RepID=UPI0031E8A5FE
MPLLDFSQWGFLSAPLNELLDRLGARIVEIATDEEHFFGGCMKRDSEIVVVLPQRMNELEKDLSTRGLLAHWFGVEITDWPMQVSFADVEQAA